MIEEVLRIAEVMAIAGTIALFVFAAITHGFTHNLLLEAAVFLVSLKLILASARQSRADEEILRRLESIERSLGSR